MRSIVAAVLVAFATAAPAAELDPALLREAKRAGAVDVLIVPVARPSLASKALPTTRVARIATVHRTLELDAANAQHGVRRALDAAGVPYRAYAIANVVQAKVPASTLQALAQRGDVAAIVANTPFPLSRPKLEGAAGAKAPSFNLVATGATTLWSEGIDGTGIVVGGQDTGYEWSHPALIRSYRGHTGGSPNHAYAWHDAIHAQVNPTDSSNPCGYERADPCDDDGHGTHTMGIAVGDDAGANEIGMAPGARWIGCRNMDQGWGSPATYIECAQWFLAPTDANGANPNPAMAPHVINNSWGCPGFEGCDAVQTALLEQAVANLRAAGILFVVSAGNAGPGCNTITDAPATFPASFAIGAADNGGNIVSFSSRGPVGEVVKPDITAPGLSIRSSVPGGLYASISGTSMASPHVAGAAALIMQAAPLTIGRPALIEHVLRDGAQPRTQAGENCGGYAGDAVPNAVHGHGFLDAHASAGLARTIVFADQFE